MNLPIYECDDCEIRDNEESFNLLYITIKDISEKNNRIIIYLCEECLLNWIKLKYIKDITPELENITYKQYQQWIKDDGYKFSTIYFTKEGLEHLIFINKMRLKNLRNQIEQLENAIFLNKENILITRGEGNE